MTLFLNPAATFESFKKELLEFEKNKTKLEEVLCKAGQKLEDTKIRISSARERKAVLEVRNGNLDSELDLYDKKLKSLNTEIALYGLTGDLHYGNMEEKLTDLTDKAASAMAASLNRYHDLERKKLLLGDLDYYIPDEEIKLVNNFLKESGINCMPGALWIKSQDENRREELLYINPILPYSIVVEASDFEKVKSLSLEIVRLVEQYPVAIVANSFKGIQYSDGREPDDVESLISRVGMDEIKNSGVYILRASNNRMLLDEKEFDSYLRNIDTNLKRAVEEAEALRKDHEALINLTGRIRTFTSEYNAVYRHELNGKIKSIQQKLDACEKECACYINEKEDIEKRRTETEELIKNATLKIESLQADMKNIEAYIQATEEIKKYRNNLCRLDPEIRQLEADIRKMENLIETLNTEISQILQRINEASRKQQDVQKRLSNINENLVIKEFTMIVSGTAQEVEGVISALESRLSNVDINSIKAAIESLKSTMSSTQKEITKRGFEENDFEDVFEKVPEDEIKANELKVKEFNNNIKQLEISCNKILLNISQLVGRVKTLEENISGEYGKAPADFDDIDALNEGFFQGQLNECQSRLKKINSKVEDLKKRGEKLDKNLDNICSFISYREIGLPKEMRGEMHELKVLGESITMLDMMKKDPSDMAVLINNYKSEYDKNNDVLIKGQNSVKSCFEKLYSGKEWEENTSIKQVLSNIMSENLFNVEYVNNLFINLFASIEKMKQAEQMQLDECRRNKDEIVERCYTRAEAVYDEIKLVDTFSKIKVNGESIKTIRIDMPKLDEDRGKAMMALYLEVCIDEIEKMKADGSYDPAKIDNAIIEMMSPARLLDAVSSLNDIIIKVFKPEHNMELSSYIPWEVVIQWSGGEKLAGFFAMFISIISYLRYKRTGWQGSPKVIWIDNPFGQANAGHLLEYIFELAKSTKTQMICLTGLQEVNIYAQFDVVYSLVHRMLSNMSVIQSKLVKSDAELESAYYKVDHEQMNIFGL